MPTNVEHDNDQQSQIALQLLLALSQGQQGQQQAPQQQQPSDPNADILSQIAPLTAARANGSAPLNSYAVNGDAPSYQSPSRHRAASYASYGGVDEAATGQDKLANQDILAQYRAQQADQRLSERASDQANLREQQDADSMNREQSHDLPQPILMGLADGSLRYTPAQKRLMQEDQDAHVRVDNDPTLSPADRARFHAKIAQHDRQNRLAVQRTPQDEMPVTPQQQAQQSSWQEVDPVSGITVTKHAGPVRNGVQAPPVLDPVSEAHIKDWQDQQKHNRAAELKQMELQQKQDEAKVKALDLSHDHLTNRRDKLAASMHKAYDEMRKADAQWASVNGEMKDAKGNVIPVSSEDRQAALQRLYDTQNHYRLSQQEWQDNNDKLDSLTTPPDSSASTPSDETPQSVLSDPNGPGQIDVNATVAPGSISADDAATTSQAVRDLPPTGPAFPFPTVSKPEDYAAIPSGKNAQYYDPQGNLRTKR